MALAHLVALDAVITPSRLVAAKVRKPGSAPRTVRRIAENAVIEAVEGSSVTPQVRALDFQKEVSLYARSYPAASR